MSSAPASYAGTGVHVARPRRHDTVSRGFAIDSAISPRRRLATDRDGEQRAWTRCRSRWSRCGFNPKHRTGRRAARAIGRAREGRKRDFEMKGFAMTAEGDQQEPEFPISPRASPPTSRDRPLQRLQSRVLFLRASPARSSLEKLGAAMQHARQAAAGRSRPPCSARQSHASRSAARSLLGAIPSLANKAANDSRHREVVGVTKTDIAIPPGHRQGRSPGALRIATPSSYDDARIPRSAMRAHGRSPRPRKCPVRRATRVVYYAKIVELVSGYHLVRYGHTFTARFSSRTGGSCERQAVRGAPHVAARAPFPRTLGACNRLRRVPGSFETPTGTIRPSD